VLPTRTKPLARQTLRVLDCASRASTLRFNHVFDFRPYHGNCRKLCSLQGEGPFNPHSPASAANASGFLLVCLSKMPRLYVSN
jgi:hypothetical protein